MRATVFMHNRGLYRRIMRNPYKFALDQKVQYHHPHTGWSPIPMRVLTRTHTEALRLHATGPHYTIERWELTGDWAIDRPIAQVWEHDLKSLGD